MISKQHRFTSSGLILFALFVGILLTFASRTSSKSGSDAVPASGEIIVDRESSSRFPAFVARPPAPASGTFSNGANITINDNGVASPYPSTIAVSGLAGTVSQLTVAVNGFSHTAPDDVDMLLVAPNGARIVFLADVGGTNAVGNLNLVIDDAAIDQLPDNTTLVSGTFRPTVPTEANSESFPAPAPCNGTSCVPADAAAPEGTATFANRFTGLNPNGTWSLYVVDTAGGDSGSISGGWSLTITTASLTATSTTIISSQNPSFANQAVTFTGTVKDGLNPVTSGSVTFKDGSNNLTCTQGAQPRPLNGSGQAQCTVAANSFSQGSHTINADYAGSGSFANSSGSVSQFVDNPTTINGNTFSNTGSITINDTNIPPTIATPYPSHIFVSGLAGTITKVVLTLNGLSHTSVADIDMLLVGPLGQKLVILSDVGSNGGDANTANLTLDDAASPSLPGSGGLSTGTFRPTDINTGGADSFPGAPAGAVNSPAPAGTATFSSIFDGTSPNGTWSLYVIDDNGSDSGNIAGGWSLTITSLALTATTTTVNSSQNPLFKNQPVTFTATVKDGPNPISSGSVTFKEGSTNLSCTQGAQPLPLNGSGQAACTVVANGFSEGSHLIDALYGGTATFAVSSANVTQIVDNPTAINANTFCNPGAIAINDSPTVPTKASPYPSHIFVSGVTGTINKVTLTLNSLSHNSVTDMDILLIGPQGEKFATVSDVGSNGASASNVTLVLEDSAASALPNAGGLSSGTFRPTDINAGGSDTFPSTPAGTINSAAPAGAATFASIYNGTNPNGTWSLYILDDNAGVAGSLAGGWCLTLLAAPAVTTHPTGQSVCPGTNVQFTSVANGLPEPTVQWQVSTDGGSNWINAAGVVNNTSANPGQITTTLNFTATASDNGKLYRTHFTNSSGSVDSNTATLLVTGSPTLGSIEAAPTVYSENAAATLVTSNLTVSHGINLASATVQITSGYANSQDVLGFLPSGGISGSFDATTGRLNLSGAASPAAYQVVLRSVTYANTSDTPNTSTRTITFLVTDGGSCSAVSNAQARDITVVSINDPPAGADKLISTNEDAAYSFVASDFGFSDTDGNALSAVKIATLPVAGSLTNNNLAVSAGDSIAVADINAGKLKFTPGANANGIASASFTFQVQDNGGTSNSGADLDQSPNSITFNIASVNDAPAGTDNNVATNEDVTYTFAAGDFGFTDPDDTPANSLLAVKITTLPAVGSLTNNNLAVSAGDSIAVADINAGKLKFTPVNNGNGIAYASLTFQVQDNGGSSNSGADLDQSPNSIAINVVTVNDVPFFEKGPDQGTNTTAAQAVANWATNISPGPPDEVGQALNFIVTNDNNTLFSAQPAVSPNGTLTYSAAVGQTGQATVSVSLHDNGGVANGGQDTSAVVMFVITLTAVDLTVTKTHLDNFIQGGAGKTYTISVINNGQNPSSGTVTVTDSLPEGLVARSLIGTGWNCDPIAAAGVPGPAILSCNRNDAVAANGGSFPDLTLTVDVACNANANLTNVATVSGGNDGTPGNNTANDNTVVSLDSTPPVLVCPGGVSRYTDSGQNTAAIILVPPVASDNCGNVIITGVRSDGKALSAPFPIGVTIITWTAKDAASNMASCAQSVTVMVPSSPRRVP